MLQRDVKSDLREISFYNFKGMCNYMFEDDISMSYTYVLFSDIFCASDLTFPVVRVWTALE